MSKSADKADSSGSPTSTPRTFYKGIAIRVCQGFRRCPQWTTCPYKALNSPCRPEIEVLRASVAGLPKKVSGAARTALLMLIQAAFRYSRRPIRSKHTPADLAAFSGMVHEVNALISGNDKRAPGGGISETVDRLMRKGKQ